MGIIHVNVSDELDKKFRIEIIKRLGTSRGALQRAVEEATELWINRQTVEKLKAQAMNAHLLVTERKEATKMLGEIGDSALDALLDIGSCEQLIVTERDTAREMVKRILSKKKQVV